jgi:hypothetical protein
MAFAILSLTEPPADTNSSLPTVKTECHTYTALLLVRLGKDARRLHLRPSCLAILSSRMRGVLPTASRALSSIALAGNDMAVVVEEKVFGLNLWGGHVS